MIRHAKDLSPEQRTVLEDLLGRPIFADQTISVRAIETPQLSEQERQELLKQLREYFAQVDAGRKSGSPEEGERILSEAIQSVRPSHRPTS
jgi:hypothetical protein